MTIALAAALFASASLGAQDAPRIEPQFPLDEQLPEPPPYDIDSDPETNTSWMLCLNQRWRCPDPMLVASGPGSVARDFPRPDDKVKKPRLRSGKQKGPVRRVGRGTPVLPGEAPWMVQIQRPERMTSITQRNLDWEDRMFCGGAWIAPGWVLTAAHCLYDNGNNIMALGYRVRLGVNNLEHQSGGVSYRIVEIYQGPGYNPKTYDNDIALVRFAPDQATERGRRLWAEQIAIDGGPLSARNLAGDQAYFFGWGRTERNRPSAPLLSGKVRIDPDSPCSKGGIAICAKGIGPAGATQCKGDSGGPLVVWDRGTPVVVGVVSHNQETVYCGSQRLPGVYTRVARFRSWIEGRTGPLPRPASRR